MSISLRRSAPAALLVAGLVVVSGTSGAVAGTLITGKNIKDGSVGGVDIRNNSLTSTDVKDLSLEASDTSTEFDDYMRRVSGYRAVHRTAVVQPTSQGGVTATCPGESRLLGAQGWWSSAIDPVQVEIVTTGGYTRAATAYGTNNRASDDTLHVVTFCGLTAAG